MAKLNYDTCPYSGIESYRSWQGPDQTDHILSQPTRLGIVSKSDVIASAGSCFAQNIARYLSSRSFNYNICEAAPMFLNNEQAADWGYGQFSCRFGNIYTVLQLEQLLERALGRRQVSDQFWEDEDGKWFDLLRPRINRYGFESREIAEIDTREHLASVLEMFRTSTVFVFTYGLVEYWYDETDGTVFPTAPGCGYGRFDSSRHKAGVMNVADIVRSTKASMEMIREINPDLKVIITVSPVPLLATHRNMNIVQASVHSKSLLRVAVEECLPHFEQFYYFPSYEIVTQYCSEPVWDETGRNPSKSSLGTVFRNFEYYFVAEGDYAVSKDAASAAPKRPVAAATASDIAAVPAQAAKTAGPAAAPRSASEIVCDEEEIYLALAGRQ
jgi:GSCFA family